MSDLSIRPQTWQDVDAVQVLHVLTWQATYRGMMPDPWLDALDPAAWARRRRDDFHVGQTLVAERDGVLVGFTRFGECREDDGAGEIFSLYVHPEHWGHGMGDELIRVTLAGLPQPEVHLWVIERNERALRFYARHGLHPDGTRSTYSPRGGGFDAPELRCALRREL